MSQIFTSPAAQEAAKAWLHDVTFAAGVRTTNQRTGYYASSSVNFKSWYVDAAIKICNELINRDFDNIDDSIKEHAGVRFFASLDTSNSAQKSFDEQGIAKAIVYMAELLNIYWDDTIKTTYEIAEFKKTLLGQAVYQYGRYLSAVGNTQNTGSSAATGRTRAPSAPRAAGAAPKNNFKQSGPQSGNARDLQDPSGGPGQPGVKVDPSGADVYGIVGTSTTTRNVARVFVKPLAPSGAAGKTNRVLIGSGKGFGDCVCWFEDPNDAQDFLDKIMKSGKVPANVGNLHVTAKKKEANGYFLVGTEFGTVAISARALNEAANIGEPRSMEEGFDWNAVMENMTHDEVVDLTKWARRG